MTRERGPLLVGVGLLVAVAALGYLVASYVHRFDQSAGRSTGLGRAFGEVVALTVVVLAGLTASRWLHQRDTRRQQERLAAARTSLHEMRDRYHSLFTSYPHSVYCLDLDGRFESLNLAAQGLSGCDETDLAGKHFTEFVEPDHMETTAALFAAAASGTPQQMRTAIHRSSGERVELLLRVAPILVQDDVVGVYGVAEDITDHVWSEHHLHRTQEAVGAARDGVMIGDRDSRVAYVDDAAVRLLGYDSSSEMLDRPLVTARGGVDAALRASEERHRLVTEVTREVIWDADLLTGRTTWTGAVRDVFGFPDDEVEIDLEWWRSHMHPDDVSRVIAAREAALTSTSDQFLDEYRLRDHAGRYVTLLVQGRILRDRHGSATRFLGSMLDITELRRKERELELARREAEEANNAKSLFLANMSHELRTPLSTVIAGAELVMDTGLTRPQQELLERVSRAGERLLRLVDDLLDFSAIERGDVRMDEIPFQLAPVIEQAAAWARAACEDRHLDFQLTTVNLPYPLLGDPERIGQVLSNLLDNAVKFTSSGYVRLEVSATPAHEAAGTDGVWVLFTVQDTGIGVDPAQRDEIFKSFHQADPGITRRYGGNGLGLAISKELVESMRGSIGVDSRPGHGSSFYFTVFLARSEVPAAAISCT